MKLTINDIVWILSALLFFYVLPTVQNSTLMFFIVFGSVYVLLRKNGGEKHHGISTISTRGENTG